jgi:hypothetical protein
MGLEPEDAAVIAGLFAAVVLLARLTGLNVVLAKIVLGVSDAQSTILTRRSIKKFKTKPVPEAVVKQALQAATLAPNHFMTEPWRFRLCGPKTRETLLKLNPEKVPTLGGIPGQSRAQVVVVAVVSSSLSSSAARANGA